MSQMNGATQLSGNRSRIFVPGLQKAKLTLPDPCGPTINRAEFSSSAFSRMESEDIVYTSNPYCFSISISSGSFNTLRCLASARLMYKSLSLRSEEHTSELQSRENLVCRLLL